MNQKNHSIEQFRNIFLDTIIQGENDDELGDEEEEYLEDDDDSVKDPNFSLEEEMQHGEDDKEMELDELEENTKEDGTIRFNDSSFVQIIQSVGKCLLQKSQTPTMKKKKQALKDVVAECLSEFGVTLSEQQARRKLDNLKSSVKTKIDRKKTGNVPINLNEADQLLLNLLDAEENPSIVQVPCQY